MNVFIEEYKSGLEVEYIIAPNCALASQREHDTSPPCACLELANLLWAMTFSDATEEQNLITADKITIPYIIHITVSSPNIKAQFSFSVSEEAESKEGTGIARRIINYVILENCFLLPQLVNFYPR